MERFLKDYLVSDKREKESQYSLICAVCGNVWSTVTEERDKEAVAYEAAKYNSICRFCGRPVCADCFEDVEGITLCVQCGVDLRKRLELL